jgi:hypothetical protein
MQVMQIWERLSLRPLLIEIVRLRKYFITLSDEQVMVLSIVCDPLSELGYFLKGVQFMDGLVEIVSDGM